MSATNKAAPGKTKGRESESVRSAERAVDVLFSFNQDQPVLDLPALQERTGLSRPTLYRLLRTLEAKGLIYSFGSPLRFQLGPRFGLLAQSWTPAPALVALATGPLERLWQETQETVGLMMPISPTHRMCVFEHKSPQPLSLSRGMGYSEPLYRGASGKVLLAHMQPEQRRAALALASRRDRELALKVIAAVLADGVLVTHSELIAGSVAVATPVIARTGEAVAAVCIFGSGLRLRGPLLRECQREAIRTAREISMFL